ncbi:hypothetical protein [Okeania sp. KiyG1]|uniref:hypothetical protein n=1 Tax=Okeania sp. KiyG1 TaxID=2720165 RepID=UPI001923D374|nr:hypothetical protein [Okeania sp. KiyG1]
MEINFIAEGRRKKEEGRRKKEEGKDSPFIHYLQAPKIMGIFLFLILRQHSFVTLFLTKLVLFFSFRFNIPLSTLCLEVV